MANWDGGQLSTLSAGDTLTCTTLAPGQLYGLFLYNFANADNDATVSVVWSNSKPPVLVTVPGTTDNQGLASVVLVSGRDTQTVAISILGSGAAQLQAWIGSVSMPTDTAGLNNQPLPFDGQPQPFAKYDRYYAVPPSSWQALTINSSIQQFISAQFQQHFATIYIVNPTSTAKARVTPVGPSVTPDTYTIVLGANPPQTISTNFQGDGTQWVWMNADSAQNSMAATIAAQSLTNVLALDTTTLREVGTLEEAGRDR